MTKTVKLSKPVKAHGEMVAALTLREPTGADLRTAGMPYKLDADGGIAVNVGPMSRMIVLLAAVPPSTVDALSGPDWNLVAMEVLGFIMGSEESPKTPTPTPTAPAPANQ